MPSPFPGMDPYLESRWRDLHSRLTIYLCDALQEGLPKSLYARVEDRIVLAHPDDLSGIYPDVRVVENRALPVNPMHAQTALLEPFEVEVETEPLTEPYIEIIDAHSGNKVVTIVEILSPTNKTPGDDRDAYQRKQREICQSDTNLVEIDLLRGGRHTVAIPLARIPVARRTPYIVCIRRATKRRRAQYYSIPLAQPLPAIKMPLRPDDADAVIALQPLLDQSYHRGRYDLTTNYNDEPVPPFSAAEAEWADQLLREAGVRTTPPKSKRKRRPKSSEGE